MEFTETYTLSFSLLRGLGYRLKSVSGGRGSWWAESSQGFRCGALAILELGTSVTFPASVCDPRQGISNHGGSPQLWDVAFLLGLNPIWLVWLELDLITWGWPLVSSSFIGGTHTVWPKTSIIQHIVRLSGGQGPQAKKETLAKHEHPKRPGITS